MVSNQRLVAAEALNRARRPQTQTERTSAKKQIPELGRQANKIGATREVYMAPVVMVVGVLCDRYIPHTAVADFSLLNIHLVCM